MAIRCPPPARRFRPSVSLQADAQPNERRYLPLVIVKLREPVLVWGDRLLSVGLVVGGQLAVWEPGWSFSNLALAVVVAGATVPLIWRRRFPLGALVAVAAAVLSTLVLPLDDPGGEAGFFVFWGLVLVVYS